MNEGVLPEHFGPVFDISMLRVVVKFGIYIPTFDVIIIDLKDIK